MKQSEKSYTGYYFLGISILIFIIIAIIKRNSIKPIIDFFLDIMVKILPIFILVFVIMVLINFFVKPDKLVKYLGKGAGAKGWVISIIAGIISTGPIYMWYPLLSQMRKKGVKWSYISAFLYNRAVKPALIPLMIVYFGWIYTAVLTVVMIIASILNGIIVEKLMEVRK